MDYIRPVLTFLSYLLYPLVLVFDCLVFALAPFFHLCHYLIRGLLAPVRFLAKLEKSLYIYLSTAILLGIITALILHYSLFQLNSLLDLYGPSTQDVPFQTPRRPIKQDTVTNSKKKKSHLYKSRLGLDDDDGRLKKEQSVPVPSGPMPVPLSLGAVGGRLQKPGYTDWWMGEQEKSGGPEIRGVQAGRRGSGRLLSETILEEEDGSDEFF
ncbi:MAG: hypothetical protein M1819_007218 [Sarea resinae]|nr:MAG: hypothetical protein M1819_007218 [Sarea resinae]